MYIKTSEVSHGFQLQNLIAILHLKTIHTKYKFVYEEQETDHLKLQPLEV